MANYKLTKEDYENLNKLIKIIKMIKYFEDTLCTLEINFQKDTLEYKNIYGQLKFFVMLENNIYKKLATNPGRISELLFYVMKYEEFHISDVISHIPFITIDNSVKYRLASKFQILLGEIEFPTIDEDLEETDEAEEIVETEEMEDNEENEMDYSFLSSLPSPEEAEQDFFYTEKLTNESIKDILHTILRILHEYICDEKYKNIREKLILFKYRLAFLYNEIEQEFLVNNFEINQELFWTADTVIDYYDGDEEDLILTRQAYAETMLYAQSENLITILLEGLNEANNYESAIISQIIIRASLLFVSPKMANFYSNYLWSQFKDTKIENETFEEIINSSLNNIEIDKNLPGNIGFKP